jgi:hypothetical protein
MPPHAPANVPSFGSELRRRGVMAGRVATAPLRALPSFVIIGAQKAGTSSLYTYLARHPAIGPSHKKEIQYFSYRYGRPELWYRAHFPTRRALARMPGGGITGEASPYYLFHPHAPRRVADTLPQAKIIALLRDPVARAYSNYNHHVRLGWEPLSFEDAIAAEPERLAGERERMLADPAYYSHNFRIFSYLARGLYLEQLEAWAAHFPRDRMLVLQAEQLFTEPERTYLEVLDFLGLERWSPGDFEAQNIGAYKGLAPATAERLKAFYAPHNSALYGWLGRDLGW